MAYWEESLISRSPVLIHHVVEINIYILKVPGVVLSIIYMSEQKHSAAVVHTIPTLPTPEINVAEAA